jgi:dipeptidyl aminopeptidase/acylaminoacyl peptidase
MRETVWIRDPSAKQRRDRMVPLLMVCAAFVLAGATNATAQVPKPLPVRDALDTLQFAQLTPVALSPDGRWLAYTVKNSRKTRAVDRATWARTGVRDVFTGTDIRLLRVKTGFQRSLTGETNDNFMPVWSPDGRYLAFLSDRDGSGQLRLWVWDSERNQLKRVSTLDVRQFGPVEWTPDSRNILVPAVPEGMSARSYAERLASSRPASPTEFDNKAPGSNVVVYQSGEMASGKLTTASDPWNLDIYLRDLFSVNVKTGSATALVLGQRIATFRISPDGSRVAYTFPERFEKPGSQQILFNLEVERLSSRREHLLAPAVRLEYDGAQFSWSPDSLYISYVTGGPDEKIRDCYVADADGANVRDVSDLSPVPPQMSSAPLWDARSEHLYFVRDGALWTSSLDRSKASKVACVPKRSIVRMLRWNDDRLWTVDDGESTVVLTHDAMGKQDGFYKIDLKTGVSTKLLEDGQCYTCANTEHDVTVRNDGRAVMFFAEDARRDDDLWIANSLLADRRRLTDLNSVFDKYEMGNARLVHWLSDDGAELSGVLLLPAAYREGTRYPLVVWVYGGSSESNDLDHFGLEGSGPFNMQLFATRGYAVFAPDSPQQVGTPMTDLVKSVLPGVSKVVEMGIADPTRLGLLGHSNGGYGTLSLIVQTDRFKAAIEADGMADLLGDYGEMDRSGTAFATSNLEHGQDALGGTPWEVPERYIENSPVFYLDRVETPLMIVQGSKDTVVAPYLGDEVFVDLRRLGKQVQYAKYEGEEHSPDEWTYADQVDLCNRMISWFDRFLNPASR